MAGVPGVPPNSVDGVAGVPASSAEALGQVNQSQLHLTQLLGSAGQEEVLMEQPRAHIIAKARLPRNGRVVSRKQLLRDHCTALWAVQRPDMTPTGFLVGWAE